MSTFYVDRVNLVRLMNEQTNLVDELDSALGSMPPPADGGVATSLIAFLVSAGAEAAGLVADSQRALAAITVDVLDDMSLSEQQIEDELGGLEEQLEER